MADSSGKLPGAVHPAARLEHGLPIGVDASRKGAVLGLLFAAQVTRPIAALEQVDLLPLYRTTIGLFVNAARGKDLRM